MHARLQYMKNSEVELGTLSVDECATIPLLFFVKIYLLLVWILDEKVTSFNLC